MRIDLKQTFDILFSGFVSRTSIRVFKYIIHTVHHKVRGMLCPCVCLEICEMSSLLVRSVHDDALRTTSKRYFQCKLTKETKKEDLDYQEEVNYEKLLRE